MEESIRRYFLIAIGVLGAILSATLIVTSLKTGKVPGPGLAWWVTDQGYSHASNPSQYGFMLFLFVACFAGFVWLAWHAWRN